MSPDREHTTESENIRDLATATSFRSAILATLIAFLLIAITAFADSCWQAVNVDGARGPSVQAAAKLVQVVAGMWEGPL